MDILEFYSREVLRDQPIDIVEFSYLYFKALEEGTIDTFDYPRKGKNIPPNKHDRPPTPEEEGGESEQDEGQSYYDEAGNKIEGTYEEGEEAAYGEEGQDG